MPAVEISALAALALSELVLSPYWLPRNRLKIYAFLFRTGWYQDLL